MVEPFVPQNSVQDRSHFFYYIDHNREMIDTLETHTYSPTNLPTDKKSNSAYLTYITFLTSSVATQKL